MKKLCKKTALILLLQWQMCQAMSDASTTIKTDAGKKTTGHLWIYVEKRGPHLAAVSLSWNRTATITKMKFSKDEFWRRVGINFKIRGSGDNIYVDIVCLGNCFCSRCAIWKIFTDLLDKKFEWAIMPNLSVQESMKNGQRWIKKHSQCPQKPSKNG